MPTRSWNRTARTTSGWKTCKAVVVKSPGFAKHAQILENSVAPKETANKRIFLMKDLAAVEEAVNLGAEK
jgi:hypothetical protein